MLALNCYEREHRRGFARYAREAGACSGYG